MRDTAPRPRFSIIIPLEFHHGWAMECLRGWAEGQAFARDRFEIIVAAPPDFPAHELAQIRALLSPQDQILDFRSRHDIGLCDEGARAARGEVLFFTESHCTPEADTLSQAEKLLAAHPEWAGFSCESVPVTHNLFSQVEAELYEKDIRSMQQHRWCKVLDQGFVVRRWAYLKAGGFDPELGHFAEWLLAARLHQAGCKIGYAPQARVRHNYIGRWQVWRQFTEDFSVGQMRFLCRGPADACHAMFEEVPEWKGCYAVQQKVARQIVRMLLRDLAMRLREAGGTQARLQEFWRWNWLDLRRWLGRALFGAWVMKLPAMVREWTSRSRLEWHLLVGNKPRAGRALADCCEAIAARTRADFLLQHQDEPTNPRADEAPLSPGFWLPSVISPGVRVGWHALEVADDHPFRWSASAATVELPIGPGEHHVVVHWHPVRRGSESGWRFFVDEMPLPLERIRFREDCVELIIDAKHQPTVRLGWVCTPLDAPRDVRRLGLAVREITWTPKTQAMRSTTRAEPAAVELPVAPRRALLFLHIRKTAGTALRALLGTRFAAADCLLHAHMPALEKAGPGQHALITGHVRFDYVERFATRPVVFVMLRDPVERALSAYHFFRSHDAEKLRSLEQELPSEEFAERLRFRDIAARVSLLEFLEQEPDLARAHLSNVQTLSLLRHRPAATPGTEELQEALANLASCEVIGLTERLPETLLLLERFMGWNGLGPATHENRTSARPHRASEDPRALEILAAWNQLDTQLYREAARIFDDRVEKLLQIGIAASDARGLPPAACFTFDNPVHGWGWHMRERAPDGASFCWTGADDLAWIDLAASPTGAALLRCRVRKEVPSETLKTLQITVNSQPVSHRLLRHVSGVDVEARVPAHLLALRRGAVRIGFTSDTICPREIIPGHVDHRRLGVALEGISIEQA